MLLRKYSLKHSFFIFWLALAEAWENTGKHGLERRAKITRRLIFQMLQMEIYSHVQRTSSHNNELNTRHKIKSLAYLPKTKSALCWVSGLDFCPLELGSTERRRVRTGQEGQRVLTECICLVHPDDWAYAALTFYWMELPQIWLLWSWWWRHDEGLKWEGGWTRSHQILSTIFQKFAHQKSIYF